MTISKRKLTKWRKESFSYLYDVASCRDAYYGDNIKKVNEHVLLLTQELLDQQLLKGK